VEQPVADRLLQAAVKRIEEHLSEIAAAVVNLSAQR